MKSQRLIQIGGMIDLLFVVFHLSFWKLFHWGQSLAYLPAEDKPACAS